VMTKRERGLEGPETDRTGSSAISVPGEASPVARGTVADFSEILRLDPSPVDEASLDLDDAERESLSDIPAVRDVQLRCFRESRRTNLIEPAPGEIARREAALRMERRAGLWAEFVPPRYVDASLAGVRKVDPGRADALQAWAVTVPRPNLILTGPIGIGKTYAAFAVVRPFVEAGARASYWSVGRVLQELRPGGDGKVLDELLESDLLILDDLGVEKISEWTSEQLSIVVDDRYTNLWPTIVTTNDLQALVASTRDRGRSRLLDDATFIAFDGIPFR
jgi:DNA replication protein DnaC